MPREPRQTFRVDSSQLFITWPQSGFNIDDAYEALLNIVIAGVSPIKTLIAEEKHQDGNVHHHAYLRFAKKVRITNPRAFDLFEKHGNIQGCRSPAKVIQYVIKGGNYKCNFEIKKPRNAKLAEQLDKVTNPKDFIDACVKDDPEWAISRFSNLRSFAEYRFSAGGGTCTPLRPLTDFVEIPDEIQAFIDDLRDHILGERDMKSLWLYGNTRLGKTQLARSLGIHCYMQGIWNLSCLSDNVSYAVFDDIAFTSIEYIYKHKDFISRSPRM